MHDRSIGDLANLGTLYTVSSQAASQCPAIIMIVIHEDILNKVLVVHFLLFFANLIWVFFFSFYLGFKFNPNFKSSLRIPTSGWFGRQPRPVQTAPVYQDTAVGRQRRGWFGGDRG